MNCRHRAILKRIAILMMMTGVILVLCGCRTRITNNNEVSNVMYDEDGFLQEEYDLRRDELSLSTAKKPIITGLGGTESDEDFEDFDYDSDAQSLEDYEPEGFDDEEEDTESASTSGTSSGSGTSTSGKGNVARRRTVKRTSSNTNTMIEVVLDANGGTCSEKSIKVKKDSTYGSLPSATREGYEFEGWFTRKNEGKQVTKDTKVTASAKHTLYAHWKKPEEQEKPEHKITFEGNGDNVIFVPEGDNTRTVKEGGVYPTLPVVTREKYIFEGWYTEKDYDKGKRIKEGDPFKETADQTLYAHWKEDFKNYWTEDLSARVPEKDEDKYKYIIYGDKDAGSFLRKSGLAAGTDEEYDYIVFFGSKSDAAGIENPEGKRILVVPELAIKGTTKDEVVLMYEIYVFDKIYRAPDADPIIDIGQAESDLGASGLEKVVFADE